jgi:hypothetical protein
MRPMTSMTGRATRQAAAARRVTDGRCARCELWLVQRDLDDPDVIRVTEMWARREHCGAALNLPGVEKNAAQVMGLLDGPPEVADTQLLERYDLDDVGEARYIREHLGDELFELRPLDAVRVAPASARGPEAGPDGLEVLAFGSHSPGDGEMVADWWTT